MKAQDAVDGGLYNLPAKGQWPGFNGATCNGWNHSHEWLLFVVADEYGKRKMKLVMPTDEIQPVEHRIALGQKYELL